MTDYKKPADGELKKKLTPMQYEVTQHEATERPFQNEYWNNHEAGIYVDVVSGEPLFSSLDKYESGTGWPSFTKPLVPENVKTKTDRSLFMTRTEVRSAHADSHLGHLFDDGPAPTGQRYCMNSASMRFIPVSKLAEEGYGEYLQLFETRKRNRGHNTMSIGQSLLPEFDQETSTTRKVLERVPTEKGQWKPHPKSFPLGHLAQLVAGMPGWLPRMLMHAHLDLGMSSPYTFQATEALLAQFDRGVRDGRAALGAAEDASFEEPWALKHGDHVLFTMPRGVVVRQHFNHMVHHRAQLGVYLRLLDIPVPSMYGPTADERM